MDKKKNDLLTASQLAAIMVGLAVGPEFLRLPGVLVESVFQDAWISTLIALIYPVYIILISSYIAKRHPEKNIIGINKLYFGRIAGSILSGFFALQFFIYIATILGEFTLVARIYIAGFLSPLKVMILCLSITALAASKGIKTLAKTTEVISYIMIPPLLITLFIFQEGSIGNLRPVFQSGALNIIKASAKTIYFYTGFEGVLFIHPMIRKNVNITKTSIKALLFCSVIWVWTVLSTIIFLGTDIIPKSTWPFFLVYDSVNFPIINNIRYIFMFEWSLISFRMISIYILLSHSAITGFIKIKLTSLFYITLPILAYITFKFSNNLLRQKFLAISSPTFVVFNIVLLTVIALISKFKKVFK